MKFRQITLQQCDNEDDLYIVHKLVDCLEPKVGSVLSSKQAIDLIDWPRTKVIVLRGKS